MLVKICGLTDVKEVDYLKENNVDFAGIVMFYEKSKRNTSVEKAKEIVGSLHNENIMSTSKVKAVAVTVEPTFEQIEQIYGAKFDYIQIHGKVSDEILINCPLPVLKAFNIKDLPDYEHYLTIETIKGFVFDAGEPGSGKTFDWDMLNNLKRDENRLYILAGGLNENNVKAAIEAVRPDAVDVSSGVELPDVFLDDGSIKTFKDREKIKLFVKNAR